MVTPYEIALLAGLKLRNILSSMLNLIIKLSKLEIAKINKIPIFVLVGGASLVEFTG